MNNEELTAKHLAIHFQTGWNESLETVAEIIDDFCFATDKEENIEIKRDLKDKLKRILKPGYELSDVFEVDNE